MSDAPFAGIREIFEECDRLEAQGKDIVHLEIGRPDFDTPSPIKQGAIDALERGDVHYTSNYGIRPCATSSPQNWNRKTGLNTTRAPRL